MSELARRYARALFESGDAPVEEALLQQLCGEIVNCSPLWTLLRNPVIHPEQKTAVLEALPLFSGEERLLRFFCLLAQKERLRMLPDVLGAYHGLMLNRQKFAHCKLTSARPLDEAQMARLHDVLCKKHNKRGISFVSSIDESLLGGFVLEIEGVTYDQSVRGQFQGLARHLSEVNPL